ncbi:immunity protein TriTu family protein [Rhizobium alvei]
MDGVDFDSDAVIGRITFWSDGNYTVEALEW